MTQAPGRGIAAFRPLKWPKNRSKISENPRPETLHFLTLRFNVPGESLGEAFLRRLKSNDPARAIYEEYVVELKERWGDSAQKLSAEQASKKITEIEKKYKLESRLLNNPRRA